MIITRPNHDVTTNHLYYWSEKIIQFAKDVKEKVVSLDGKRANKKEFQSVVQKIKPSLIVFNGHGNEKTVTGYDNEPLIEENNNEQILNGSIVYARSCSSAKSLGQSCVKNGTNAYLGYDDEFTFIIDETKITRPLYDTVAALFLEPSNFVVICLLKGLSAQESHTRSLGLFKDNIRRLMTSDTKLEDTDALPYLVWDYMHQVCLGNISATIYD